MWPHGIADASLGAGESVALQHMACRACDRSSSSIDVRHNMTASAIYNLPFGRGKQFFNAGLPSTILGGWELAGIASARTGLPVNIAMTPKTSPLPDGNTSSPRPALLAGVSLSPSPHTTPPSVNPPPSLP